MAELREYVPPTLGMEGVDWVYGEIYDKKFPIAEQQESVVVTPDLDSVFIEEVARNIRPVRRETRGSEVHVMIGQHDPVRHGFSWVKEDDGPVELSSYSERTLPTLHGYGMYSYFKPSVEEVVGQLPAELLPGVAHFKTEIDGETPTEIYGSKLNDYLWPKNTVLFLRDGIVRARLLGQTYHIAETTVYFRDEHTAAMFDIARAV